MRSRVLNQLYCTSERNGCEVRRDCGNEVMFGLIAAQPTATFAHLPEIVRFTPHSEGRFCRGWRTKRESAKTYEFSELGVCAEKRMSFCVSPSTYRWFFEVFGKRVEICHVEIRRREVSGSHLGVALTRSAQPWHSIRMSPKNQRRPGSGRVAGHGRASGLTMVPLGRRETQITDGYTTRRKQRNASCATEGTKCPLAP
jgi:hypothetical protein